MPEEEQLEYVPGEWTELEEFGNEAMARMAEGLLRENGIECRLEDVSFHAGPVPLVPNLTRFKLWVPPDMLEAADRVLAEVEDNPGVCPVCGAEVPDPEAGCPSCSEEPPEDSEEAPGA